MPSVLLWMGDRSVMDQGCQRPEYFDRMQRNSRWILSRKHEGMPSITAFHKAGAASGPPSPPPLCRLCCDAPAGQERKHAGNTWIAETLKRIRCSISAFTAFQAFF